MNITIFQVFTFNLLSIRKVYFNYFASCIFLDRREFCQFLFLNILPNFRLLCFFFYHLFARIRCLYFIILLCFYSYYVLQCVWNQRLLFRLSSVQYSSKLMLFNLRDIVKYLTVDSNESLLLSTESQAIGEIHTIFYLYWANLSITHLFYEHHVVSSA